MLLVVLDQLRYLLDQLVLGQRLLRLLLLLLLRRGVLCLVHIDLLGLLTSCRLVQTRLRRLVTAHIGSRAKSRGLGRLLGLGVGSSVVGVSTHRPREEVLLLHLMLHLLLLLSGDGALIRGRPLDVASAADTTRCVHGRG